MHEVRPAANIVYSMARDATRTAEPAINTTVTH